MTPRCDDVSTHRVLWKQRKEGRTITVNKDPTDTQSKEKSQRTVILTTGFTQVRVIGIVKHDHSGKWRNEIKNRNR